jgi:hypothetical protein
MPAFYQPRRGGVIEVVSETTASEILADSEENPDSTEHVGPEDKFIDEYIQQNSKRIQVEPLFWEHSFFSKNTEII